MRHRAPRPFVVLWHRLTRATLRGVGGAVKDGPIRAVAFLILVVGLGLGGWVTSTVGGPSTPSGSGLPSPEPDAGPSQPTEGGTPSGDRDPDVAGQESASSSEAGPTAAEPSDGAAPTSGPARRVLGEVTTPPSIGTGTPSTSPSPSDDTLSTLEDLIPPTTLLSAEYPEPDAAVFSLSSNEAASFTCSLDGSRWTACGSPTRYSDLDPGWHTFAVRATDDAGNVDRTPAETRWLATAEPPGAG